VTVGVLTSKFDPSLALWTSTTMTLLLYIYRYISFTWQSNVGIYSISHPCVRVIGIIDCIPYVVLTAGVACKPTTQADNYNHN
jgi:hypothetical protein